VHYSGLTKDEDGYPPVDVEQLWTKKSVTGYLFPYFRRTQNQHVTAAYRNKPKARRWRAGRRNATPPAQR
jgi:hypothetical protein